MPYDEKDPRSSLSSDSGSKTKTASQYRDTQYIRFYEMEPSETSSGIKCWYGRGQNFVLEYIEAEAGAELVREDHLDEYVILLPDPETSLEISAYNEAKDIHGYSITIVPPGKSRIQINNKSRLVRLFSSRSKDLADKCVNADSYANPDPNVAPFQPWPDPVDGFKIRTYSLDVPEEEGRFGKIWRCSTIMVNYLNPAIGPRPRNTMSPHSHDDFEQCSLILQGDYQNHVRWPWGTNMDQWKDDEHEIVKAPSMIVIPPPSIHTTSALGHGRHQLIDIFCPPRVDFSEKKGWVLNSDEYPMP